MAEEEDLADEVPAKESVFGGCGCGSPQCYRLPNGNLELSYPDSPENGRIELTERQLENLMEMIHEALDSGILKGHH